MINLANVRAIVFLCGFLLSLPAAARDIYHADFAAATQPEDLKDWRLTAGRYGLDAGWLTITSERSNPEARLTASLNSGVTFRGVVREAVDCHRTWMIVRGAYRLEINNQFRRVELHRLVGGQWKMLAAAGHYDRFARNRHVFELRLVLAGGLVRAFIDDNKLIDCTDPEAPPTGGGLILGGGWGSNIAWRDIRVSDEADLSEWPSQPMPRAGVVAKVTRVRGLTEDNIYSDDEPAGFKFSMATTQPEGGDRKVRLTFRLVDIYERVVAEKSDQVTLPAGGKDASPGVVEFRPPARGAFKVAVSASSDGRAEEWIEDLGCFVVNAGRRGQATTRPESYFGGHMDGINLAWHLKSARRLGVQWARCHDMLQHTWWTRVQPGGPNDWKWSDQSQRTVDAQGFSTLGVFLWTPVWAAGGKPPQSPPRDEAAFARYVGETVRHYKGSIRHWEVWNEPHYGGFWAGTPEEYARLLTVAYREAKKADPESFVLGGGGVWLGSKDWIARMIAALPAERVMDGFSIHYLRAESAAQDLAWLRAELKKRSIDVPIWNTEESVLTTSFLDQRRPAIAEPEARFHFRNACSELVRTYMENIANGVQRVFYYELADPWRFGEFPKPRPPGKDPLGTGVWDEGRMPKPIAAAHAAMTGVLEGRRFFGRVNGPDWSAFIFHGADGSAAVICGTGRTFAERRTVSLALRGGIVPEELSLLDFMGNQTRADVKNETLEFALSREPVYVVYRGDAKVLRGLLEEWSNPSPLPPVCPRR